MENKLYKIMVVSPNGIDKFGLATEDSFHALYLLDYIKNKFSTISSFNKLNSNVDRQQMADYFVYKTGYVIILNGTSKNNDNYYGSCLVIMSPNLTAPTTIEQLKKLIPHFNKFNRVDFLMEIEDDNCLYEKSFYSKYRTIPDDIWDEEEIKKYEESPYIFEKDIDEMYKKLKNENNNNLNIKKTR